jgi:2-keto-4-pentenoate hydratase/2-oxohepta-3-ene-1,7-dioic acid hydratase in catechol pathway
MPRNLRCSTRNEAIRCLSSVVRDIDRDSLSEPMLTMIRGIDPAALPKVEPSVRIGACVARAVNYVCIGLNYAEDAVESARRFPRSQSSS